jgi:hypothetical protein
MSWKKMQASDERGARPTCLGRLLQWRFSSRKRAALALLATWISFLLVSWLIFEVLDQKHHFHSSFLVHLSALPEEVFVESLCAPLMMPLAIPALFYTGNLFQWEPGWFGSPVFLMMYWSSLGLGFVACFWTRRAIWWLFVVLILVVTAPRLGQLILLGLLV